MFNQLLRDTLVRQVFPRVQMPAQYLGGELNMVRKDHRSVRGKLCMAFPDAYTIGMSHHGLQVLYTLMNAREDWACERVFCPWPDMEQHLRQRELPLYSLENFMPLHEFDVFGFTMQYEVCTSNVLTMLDLGGIPLHSEARTMADPLILAGGPCAQNPEPMAPFVDVFVTGDGEPSLPAICDLWLELRNQCKERGGYAWGEAGRKQRAEVLARIAATLPYAYVPRFYEPEYLPDGRLATINRTRSDVPETIEPCVISDLDAMPLPTRPIVPFVECVHDRIAIEIMRGCPWQCRFCQSTVIKRPLRIREVETIVQAALESYRNTGYQEISILSLSTSDYPYFEQLVNRLHEVFRPLGVSISVPSLRVNEMLKSVTQLIDPKHRNSLTLAPEVARDDMREQIRKKISNQDLYDGCREAFHNGFEAVKLYFLCGLPGEREVDLDGIIEMADTISKIGKQETGRFAKVTASVSNFVPKAHTPYQWNGMQSADYFSWAHKHLRNINRNRSVVVKCHDTETSLLEGVLSRGDRRTAAAVELAWKNGSRMESWREHMKPEIWWNALEQTGVNVNRILHEPSEIGDRLPWDHINVKKGRAYLEKEQNRAVIQLTSMADAK